LGMALGQLPLPLPGLPSPIRLGLAGGPLIAAILLSRLGHIGRLVWFLPSAAQLALRDFGIVLFLASVGIKSGGHLAEILASGSAPAWILSGFAITLGPVLVVGALARLLLRMNFLTIIGLMAGSMTDTPALAFANAQHPGSSAPSLAYATVYPLVVFLRVLAPQLLVLVLS